MSFAGQPTATCVIATRNRKDSVVEAIESVLPEPIALEIVVVDDGSDDGSFDAVSKRYAGDSRIVFVRHEQRQGPGATRNTGLRAARGRYVTFLDDDDLNIAGRIAGQVALAQSADADFVTSSLCLFETSDGTREHGQHFTQIRLKDAWLRNPFINVTCLGEASLLKRLEFDSTLSNGQDLDLWVRCLINCRKTVNYQKPVIRYRRLGQASVSGFPTRKFRARLKYLRKHARSMGPFYAAAHLGITFAKLVMPEPHMIYGRVYFAARKLRARRAA